VICAESADFDDELKDSVEDVDRQFEMTKTRMLRKQDRARERMVVQTMDWLVALY